jgi:hypothetical protein
MPGLQAEMGAEKRPLAQWGQALYFIESSLK